MHIKQNIVLALTFAAGLPLTGMSALDDGLVGYYSFESGVQNAVTLGGLPDGTAVNSPAAGTAGGRSGNALACQGADNDHMNLVAGFGTGATLGGNFTISVWYNLNDPITSATTSDRYFVYESSNDYDVSYGLRNSSLGSAGINDGQVYTQTGNFSIADAGLPGWHHILQTYVSAAGTTTIHSYLDGVKVDVLTIPTSNFTGNGFNFGSPRSSVTDRGFDGLIDEVGLWGRVLSDTELVTVYALGLNAKPLISSAPPATAPSVEAFTATPDSVPVGGSSTLAWDVSGADSVTINEGLGGVAASGSQGVTLSAERTYTLVAIKDHTITTAQVGISVSGPTDPMGPYVGTLTTTEAYFMYSPGRSETDLRLTVMTEAGVTVTSVDTTTLADHDYVAKFKVSGLSPGTTYRYKVEEVQTGGSTVLFAGDDVHHQFTTVPVGRSNQVVKAAFLSCVNDSTDNLWSELANQHIDLLCLGGDVPYLDTGDLAAIRDKYRHMMQRPNLMALGRNISVVGTWDDHDFGLNNGNGVTTASRRVNTRRGHVEYRAHDQYGTGTEGIYHKVDMGAMEVFLLDPRWWSQTAPSPVDASQSTCFGSVQWQWMLDAIRNSEAPFKVLLQGQVWQDKKNSETDDMFTYWSERDALLDIIKAEKIPGVVLVGGDIHLSRYLLHPQRVGYDLHDFVTSPGHSHTIASLNVYHPSLEWSRVAPHQFLTLKADTTKSVPELTAQYVDDSGTVRHELVISYDQLSFRDGAGLGSDLRALWTFDEDVKNQTLLGSRLDGTLVNGASRSDTGGVRGGAVHFSRAGSQHLTVPRSFLDDNAKTYTVSAWCKPDSLPAHGGSERHFIMESMVNNHVSLPNASTTGYAISVGFQATTDADKVNLQLYTETLDPEGVGSLAEPGTTGQGGFDCDLERSVFDTWTHVVVTFDSTKLKLYVNGTLAQEHTLPTAAPLAETGGLVIGGHRAGTGRNFDGSIDEVAVWQRVLTDLEIAELYNDGAAEEIPAELSQLDADQDSLPDWWEELHGLSPDSAADALSDSDSDELTALEEFGFGTLPGLFDAALPYRQAFVDVAGVIHHSIIYQRNPVALNFLDIGVQRSTDLLDENDWSGVHTLVSNVDDLGNGLEEVTERSVAPSSSQAKEFLRVQFSQHHP